MNKTVLITGSTDGIGLATAKSLLLLGHTVLIHGRSENKLANVKSQLLALANPEQLFTYQADLSVIDGVKTLIAEVRANHNKLDVIINNAGVFMVPETVSPDGYDVRFMVNTIAPYILTQHLLPLLDETGRVVNLSSAAQSSIVAEELIKPSPLSDNAVYAKSKTAITMWTRALAQAIGTKGPSIVAINPKSFLGSKMVEQAYGVAGGNLQIGADILVKASLSDDFAGKSGMYFDNDIGQFTSPHQDALDLNKIAKVTQILEEISAQV